MKILVVSDIESNYIWDFFDKSNFRDIECVISCGDLKASYLSFLVTMLAVPVFYVHGNHDKQYLLKPPEGCDCIESKVVEFRGLRIAGLGGSIEYKGGPFQYTEDKMQKRVKKLIRTTKQPIDIFVSHSPTFGLGDDPNSQCHVGFKCFNQIYQNLQPSIHLYGHNHFTYSSHAQRILRHDDIQLINGYNYYILEI
ncbi:MAG: metallophosphoesterase [Cellulosilyticum sp.]|nr:metallophosphoesterase [Cellulosilyticum sp.]